MFIKTVITLSVTLMCVCFMNDSAIACEFKENVSNGAPFDLIQAYQKIDRTGSRLEKCSMSGKILYQYKLINNSEATEQWNIINYQDCFLN